MLNNSSNEEDNTSEAQEESTSEVLESTSEALESTSEVLEDNTHKTQDNTSEVLEESTTEEPESEFQQHINYVTNLNSFAYRSLLIPARLKQKILKEDMEFINYCNENLLDYMNQFLYIEDLIDVVPNFVKHTNYYTITNLTEVEKSLINYKKKKCQFYGIPTKIKKVQTIKLFSIITQETITKNKFSQKQVEQIMLWYAIHNVISVYEWSITQSIDFQLSFWRCIIQYYIARVEFETHNILEDIENIGKPCIGDDMVISENTIVDDEIRNNRAFCYIIFLGIYNNKLIFKIGKSDRQEIPYNERFKEHFEDEEYPDVTILKVIKCSNSTQLERIMKKTWALNKILWANKLEIYSISNIDSIICLVNTFNEYIINDSSRANKILLENLLKDTQAKCIELKKELKEKQEKLDIALTKIERQKEKLDIALAEIEVQKEIIEILEKKK
jgi:hypothetical protein